MRKKEKKINFEWIRITIDYFSVSSKADKNIEVIFPIMISFITSMMYYIWNDTEHALKVFSELLLNLDSILIGFTGILVTLLLTTENKTINTLREKEIDRKLYGKKVNLFDLLHILFTNALLNELILLLIVLFNLFLMGLICNKEICLIGLIIEESMILNIIFSMIRGVNNLYWTFKKN